MLNSVNIDVDAIENGVWVPLLGSCLKIASTDCKAFKAALFNVKSVLISEHEFFDILAETILVDWADVKDPNGNELIYSKELAKIALMSNEPLRVFVESFSNKLKNYERKS